MSIKPLTILMAEDNEDHAELMIDTLRGFNVSNQIHHVTNGEEVMAYLSGKPPFDSAENELPDIIMLDLKMPRMDGKKTLEAIRSDDRFKHIPVAVISTSANQEEITQCYKLGANSYLTKPVSFESFSKKIKELNLYWVLTSELPGKPEGRS